MGRAVLVVVTTLLHAADALRVATLMAQHGAARVGTPLMQHSVGWDGFGKGPFRFYENFDAFMTPFPAEDREMYPEMFELPKGCYEVALQRPLGIAFEEVSGGQPKGVVVDYLVEGSNAEASGKIQPGDVLIAVTAVKVFGARFERKLLPATELDFDTIMAAIGSNEPKWQCKNVVLQFMRPSEADETKVKDFLQFFEIPFDHVFRTG